MSRPFSRSFLQLTPQVQGRYTHYGAQVDLETGELVNRRPSSASTWRAAWRCAGPASRASSTRPATSTPIASSTCSPPRSTYTYRSKFEEFDSIPRFDYLDFFPGTNEVRYGLVQQIYAKRPGRSGKLEPYELLSWRLNQTYYVDIADAQNQFDPNYSSAVFGPNGAPAHLSPLQSRLRIRPSPARLRRTSTSSTT